MQGKASIVNRMPPQYQAKNQSFSIFPLSVVKNGYSSAFSGCTWYYFLTITNNLKLYRQKSSRHI